MAQLLPDILATTGLGGVPAGYRDIADRTLLKVLGRPAQGRGAACWHGTPAHLPMKRS
jgi:hypothetical protein